MIKNYSSALLILFLAGAQMIQAQEGMDDVFAQLDAANVADTQPAATVAKNDAASATEVQRALSTGDTDVLPMLFNKGIEHYDAGEYDEAIIMFDAMLAIDKYDSRAVSYRLRASRRKASWEVKKLDASRAQAIADINSAWNPAPKIHGSIDAAASVASVDPETAAIQLMVTRLKATTVPSLDFNDSSIEDVVLYLAESSRDGTGNDVDFLLVGMEVATDDSNVTISLSDMSLYEALQFIVEMASLKFEVKPSLVAIMPANYVPLSEMVMKSYNITPEVGGDLESLSDSGGGSDDLFGDSSSSASGSGPVDVSEFFSIIEFPEGSSAVYQPRFHKLFVKNTLKNLKAVEGILSDLDEEAAKLRSQQVEIQTKFVEFNEGAMEELGFNWNVYGNGTAASMGLDPRTAIGTAGAAPGSIHIDPITGQTIYNDGTDRPGQNVFGGSQRSNGTVGGGGVGGAFENIQSGLLATMGGTPAAMLFGNGDIDVQISAMEQEGTADVLSAPKVTTKSGNEAVIRVAETHRYPQDYDVETGQRTAPVVKPQDWEDFDLGVSLKVTPVVDTDNGTIDLDLQPEIMKLRGFDEYKVGSNAYDGGGNDSPANGGDGSPLLARMPYFERRTVQTQVTIADGQTVVMGGMVDERTETFRDQIPFLGDIPYLGRLFRTEGSRTTKKNLTIFVEASLVDPRGMTRKERELARQVASD